MAESPNVRVHKLQSFQMAGSPVVHNSCNGLSAVQGAPVSQLKQIPRQHGISVLQSGWNPPLKIRCRFHERNIRDCTKHLSSAYHALCTFRVSPAARLAGTTLYVAALGSNGGVSSQASGLMVSRRGDRRGACSVSNGHPASSPVPRCPGPWKLELKGRRVEARSPSTQAGQPVHGGAIGGRQPVHGAAIGGR